MLTFFEVDGLYQNFRNIFLEVKQKKKKYELQKYYLITRFGELMFHLEERDFVE